MGSFRKTWRKVRKEYQRAADRVAQFDEGILEEMGIADLGGSSWQDFRRRNFAPTQLAFFDFTTIGPVGGNVGWDYIHPPEILVKWEGEYQQTQRQGFVIDFGYEVALSDLFVAPNIANETIGEHTFFIGHLPECVFDEVTLTNTGGNYSDDPPRGSFIGAHVYQVRTNDKGDAKFTSVSGYELAYNQDNPDLIFRESVKLPWKSRERLSVDYGGPVERGIPTMLILYAAGIDPADPDVANWKVQATVRFVVGEQPELDFSNTGWSNSTYAYQQAARSGKSPRTPNPDVEFYGPYSGGKAGMRR